MTKTKYLFLFFICALTGILLYLGAQDYKDLLAEGSQAPTIFEMPLTYTLSGVLSAIVGIWGIVLAFRRRQWKWLISFIILTYISVGLYAFLNYRRLNTIQKLNDRAEVS